MENVDKRILRFFSALADETRLKILLGLVDKPRTVNEIYAYVGKNNLTLSAVSHQLSQLYNLDIVAYKKKGREKRFHLSDNFCWCILRDALIHFKGKTKCKECAKIKK